MKFAIFLLAGLSFAGIVPSPLQGHYELVFQGCLDQSDSEKIELMKQRKNEQAFRYVVSFYGDQIVEETSFGVFCTLSMQSSAIGRDRRELTFEVDYAQANPFCREAFTDAINAPAYQMSMNFSERFVPALDRKGGKMGAAMSVKMNGSLFGCKEGVDFEYAFEKQTRFSRMNDPLQIFYQNIFRLVNKGDVKELKKFVKENINQELDILNTEHRDPFGRTMLMIAERSNNQKMIDLLVELGASYDAKDAEGKTVADYDQ